MRKRPLMYLACVFLAGLTYQRYSIYWLVMVCIATIGMEIWIGNRTKRIKRAAGRSVILLSAFLIGVFHMQTEEDFRAAYMSKIEDGSRITVWGECVQKEITEYGYRGFLSDCYLRLDEEVMPCNDIVVYISEDQLEIGRIHKVDGKVNMFSRARNEGNFDFYLYYQSIKIDFALDAESVSLADEGKWNWRGNLLVERERISKVYEACLSKKGAGFYKAMVLGDKISLDKTVKDLFLTGGISHILAISGLHISILGRGFYRLLRKRGTGFGIAGVLAGILLMGYCVMTGSSTSTVRAVGMMLCFFVAQYLGKSYDMLNSLGALVCYLLWENPFLIENTGFWFSVTALLGVGIVGDELLKEKDRTKGLWMSFGITLTTIPITALSYYEIPIYSAMVNALVLPLLSPVFLLAVLGGILGTIPCFLDLTGYLLKPCDWILKFYEWICLFTKKLPWSSMICGKPELLQVLIYYCVLFLGIYFLRRYRLQKKIYGRRIVLAAIVFICGLCIFFPKAKPFEISVLDVGQGDGIYISSGDGASFFIDGGSSDVEGVGEYRILPFLKAKGVQEIDYWFVSHMDRDHISGLIEVIEKGYKIKHIVLHELCSVENLDISLVKKGMDIIYIKQGDTVYSKNMRLCCLGPLTNNGSLIGEDKNENSLILQVEYVPSMQEEFKALFAGDISIEIEEALCESGKLEEVDFFKANHHGSNYSNGEVFLDVIKPEYIVVSCSATNRYGHPGKEAVKRMEESGAQVFYTMEDGQITFPLIQ